MASIGQVVSEEKIFEIVDGRTDGQRTTDDGRTPDHGHPISSPCEPYGSGELKRKSRVGRPSNANQPARLTRRHFVGMFEDLKYNPDCVVCSSRSKPGWKRKQTRYNCRQCDLAMCCIPCHEIYHTYNDFHSAASRIVYKLQ